MPGADAHPRRTGPLGLRVGLEPPRASESVDLGAIFRLVPGLLGGSGHGGHGRVEVRRSGRRAAVYTLTLSQDPGAISGAPGDGAAAQVTGSTAAWVGALSPSATGVGSSSRRPQLAGTLLDGCSSPAAILRLATAGRHRLTRPPGCLPGTPRGGVRDRRTGRSGGPRLLVGVGRRADVRELAARRARQRRRHPARLPAPGVLDGSPLPPFEPSPPAPVFLQSHAGEAARGTCRGVGEPQRRRVGVAAVGGVAVGGERQRLGADRPVLAQVVAGAVAENEFVVAAMPAGGWR